MFLLSIFSNSVLSVSCWIASSRYPSPIWVVAGMILVIILFNFFVLFVLIDKLRNARNTIPGIPNRRFFSNNTTSDGDATGSSNLPSSDNNPPRTGRNFGRNIRNVFSLGPNTDKAKDRHHNRSRNVHFTGAGFSSQENRQQSGGDNHESDVMLQVRKYAHDIAIFLPVVFILGFTWGSFTFYINSANTAFSYVFIALNGLQGVFLFLTRIVFSREARNIIIRRLRRSRYSHLLSQFSSSAVWSSRPTESTTQQSTSNR